MANIPEFVAPPWLDDQDAETIHARMMATLPEDIDDTEGGFPWDFTKPTALEKAEMLEYHLIETLKIMHPMWSYGEYLDYHASGVGTKRKSATAASGTITVTGVPGTIIPAGFLFAVPASGDQAAITFKTTILAVIGAAPEGSTSGSTIAPIEAETAGTGGNVSAGAISIMASPPITGIVSIANSEATSGGTEEEDDESLRERIMEINESSDASFVGCDSDYKRWAKEVDGVGNVLVVPEWNGAGTVKVVVLDANGEPANSTIITAVTANIVSPGDRSLRKAPIGAEITIVAPGSLTLNFSCDMQLKSGETESTVLARFKNLLHSYYVTAKEDGVVKYNQISSLLTSTEGVNDFDNLTVNGAAENITIDADKYPVTGTITTSTGVG